MAAARFTTGRKAGRIPVACTLSSADLAEQSDSWKQLADRAQSRRVETADGLRVYFRADAGVAEELRRLAAIENVCCAWAHWEVRTIAGEVVLDIRSDGDGVATLQRIWAPGQGDDA